MKILFSTKFSTTSNSQYTNHNIHNWLVIFISEYYAYGVTIPLAVKKSQTSSLHITTDHSTYSKICSIQDKVTRTLAWCSISKVCRTGEIIPLILHKTIHYTGWCLSYLLPCACMFVSDVCLFRIDKQARGICDYLWILKVGWHINQHSCPSLF